MFSKKTNTLKKYVKQIKFRIEGNSKLYTRQVYKPVNN